MPGMGHLKKKPGMRIQQVDFLSVLNSTQLVSSFISEKAEKKEEEKIKLFFD